MTTSLSLFQALADPSRLRILALIRQTELAVGELALILGQSQPRVSRHIRILVDAGLVARRKEGSWMYLSLAQAPFLESTLALVDRFERDNGPDPESHADIARIATIRAERARFAQSYFARHAENWDALRKLHVDDAAVEAAIQAALSPEPLGRLLDVGTGTGRMLELLAPHATRAWGIDRSPEMLRLARGKLDGGVHILPALLQGDIEQLPLSDESADTIIVHQVLHYLPVPERALTEISRVLAPGGRVLIIDFATHGRDELRDAHAHVRLGFSDAQMIAWLVASGISAELVQTLPGTPLTVKIWRGTKSAHTAGHSA
ncbi:MAG: metalloregulator ArsR/SmtB family transcription factor [Alphaproteobacteria bacterium]|nr:metalloregulator ArsR/SmtB family transcription factor [Alphaproteobacteria bacterium]MDE2341475.1 metalloregulator ArsR/SmtB family transcription factor [Alphaproteobacteria bacterium]